METFAKGEIVLFSFPFTDLSNRKLRPCLILSEEMKQDILLCQITSQAIAKDIYSIELREKETFEGSLMLHSYIRTNMLFTASKNQINRKVCKVKEEKYQEVVKRIITIIS